MTMRFGVSVAFFCCCCWVVTVGEMMMEMMDEEFFGNGTMDEVQPFGLHLMKVVEFADPQQSVISVGSPSARSCKLNSNEGIQCWGGKPGTNEGTMLHEKFVQISCGSVANTPCCALRKRDAVVVCWSRGSKSDGPRLKFGKTKFLQISAGDCVCGIALEDESVRCWGSDRYGQVSNAPASGKFDQVSCGPAHCCAIDLNGKLACWGAGSSGSENVGDEQAIQVSVGSHTTALTTEGRVLCWSRSNKYGECNVNSDARFVGVCAGDAYTCGIEREKLVPKCWGKLIGALSSSLSEAQRMETNGRGVFAESHLSARWLDCGERTLCVAADDVDHSTFCFGQGSKGLWEKL